MIATGTIDMLNRLSPGKLISRLFTADQTWITITTFARSVSCRWGPSTYWSRKSITLPLWTDLQKLAWQVDQPWHGQAHGDVLAEPGDTLVLRARSRRLPAARDVVRRAFKRDPARASSRRGLHFHDAALRPGSSTGRPVRLSPGASSVRRRVSADGAPSCGAVRTPRGHPARNTSSMRRFRHTRTRRARRSPAGHRDARSQGPPDHQRPDGPRTVVKLLDLVDR